MPTTDGVFAMGSGPPRNNLEGVLSQRIQFMFVWACTPYLIGGTELALLTPAHEDGDDTKQARLSPTQLSFINSVAPQIVPALNTGAAVFEVIVMVFPYPVDMVAAVAEAETMWQDMRAAESHLIAERTYEHFGVWTEFTPPV